MKLTKLLFILACNISFDAVAGLKPTQVKPSTQLQDQSKKPQDKKLLQERIEKQITKKEAAPKFIKVESYADMQVSHLNRPGLEAKQGVFTPTEHKRDNHYNSPDMNKWANENYHEVRQNGGTINIKNKSFTLNSSCVNDPFRTQRPGPR